MTSLEEDLEYVSHMLLVGGGIYPVESVKVRISWLGDHGYRKKDWDNVELSYLIHQIV